VQTLAPKRSLPVLYGAGKHFSIIISRGCTSALYLQRIQFGIAKEIEEK
jgi:hypothetical protein